LRRRNVSRFRRFRAAAPQGDYWRRGNPAEGPARYASSRGREDTRCAADEECGPVQKKCEIWGVDDGGKFGLLAYANLDKPAVSDTILVRGQVREIEKVWRHHGGAEAILRVRVADSAAAEK
jgi:hypothetical protein